MQGKVVGNSYCSNGGQEVLQLLKVDFIMKCVVYMDSSAEGRMGGLFSLM